MEGEDVKELQSLLIQLGYDLGKWGMDGDFGDATEMAVREFQQIEGIEADGIVGKITYTALTKPKNDIVPEDPKLVRIEGGNCYARVEPNTNAPIIGTCHRGCYYPYAGEANVDGWLCLMFNGKKAWASGKYAKLIK
jgi:peptidoglycan hydrolase-like protein with peptidoglycan-binding domain